MLDSIYHMTLILFLNLISAVKALKFCHYVRNVVMDVITFPRICNPLVVYRFYCKRALFHSQKRCHNYDKFN